MPNTSSEEDIQRILREYKVRVRAIVAEHRLETQKTIAEVDRRKAERLSQALTRSKKD